MQGTNSRIHSKRLRVDRQATAAHDASATQWRSVNGRRWHRGELWLQCSFCVEGFKHGSALAHMRQHADECGVAYAESTSKSNIENALMRNPQKTHGLLKRMLEGVPVTVGRRRGRPTNASRANQKTAIAERTNQNKTAGRANQNAAANAAGTGTTSKTAKIRKPYHRWSNQHYRNLNRSKRNGAGNKGNLSLAPRRSPRQLTWPPETEVIVISDDEVAIADSAEVAGGNEDLDRTVSEGSDLENQTTVGHGEPEIDVEAGKTVDHGEVDGDSEVDIEGNSAVVHGPLESESDVDVEALTDDKRNSGVDVEEDARTDQIADSDACADEAMSDDADEGTYDLDEDNCPFCQPTTLRRVFEHHVTHHVAESWVCEKCLVNARFPSMTHLVMHQHTTKCVGYRSPTVCLNRI